MFLERLENMMSKSMLRIGMMVLLVTAILLYAWYYLSGSKKSIYTDAVLVQGNSQVAEETKDCFLLQEDDTSV